MIGRAVRLAFSQPNSFDGVALPCPFPFAFLKPTPTPPACGRGVVCALPHLLPSRKREGLGVGLTSLAYTGSASNAAVSRASSLWNGTVPCQA